MENNINLNNNNSSIDSSIEEKKKKKLFIKIVVFLSISFVLLLTTLINISRIVMFSNIFGSFIGNVKALGFCVSVKHAEFMANGKIKFFKLGSGLI